MDYVMVPVPEELAPKVLQYISWRGHPLLVDQRKDRGGDAAAPAGAPATDGDPIATVFAGLDGQSRRLLAVTATAAIRGEKLTVADTARRADLSAREVIGVMTEVNNLVASAGGAAATVLVAKAEGADEAAFSWEKRVVHMGEPAARTIVDLAPAP